MSRNVLQFVVAGVAVLLLLAVITLSVLLGVFVHKYNNAKNCPGDPNSNLPGLDFEIKTTWNNLSITHSPITFSLKWNQYNKAINVKYSAPLYRSPLPPNHTAGATPELYNYEVFEIFFLNNNNHYLEVELGPYNQWLVLLLKGEREDINTGEMIQLSVWTQLGENSWNGEAEIPLAYLPANFSLINAYNIHNEGDVTVYEAMNPTPYGMFEDPDFHRLEYFVPVDYTKFIPAMYYSQTKPYRDERYPDLWAGYY